MAVCRNRLANKCCRVSYNLDIPAVLCWHHHRRQLQEIILHWEERSEGSAASTRRCLAGKSRDRPVSQSGILQRSQPEKSPSLQFIKLQSDEMQPRFRCKILGGVERGHGPDRRKHQGRSTGETPGLLWKCGFSKLSKENIETRRSLNERLQQNKVAGTFFLHKLHLLFLSKAPDETPLLRGKELQKQLSQRVLNEDHVSLFGTGKIKPVPLFPCTGLAGLLGADSASAGKSKA